MANATQKWCQDHFNAFWRKIEWPGNSPDLNPIGNLWGIVKEKVNEEGQITRREQLIETVKSAWRDISASILENLVASMPEHNGDEDLHADPRPGRPTSSKTRSNIERVQTILDEYRRITLRELEEREGISKATLHSIIIEDLEMSKVQHDNAMPHVSSKTMAAIDDLGFEYLPHPPYSPDLPLSDYWLFGKMKRPLRGKRFENFK
ncbi:hypothetical protein LOD99_10612 [Oopsacas minuta]|uniref:Tc1-like transposase DDE domain-containing protein n=1 Tax=Oopsacas minuta TaxID=111878 RepID=A0AAV7KGX9_9METZ|nr:hypothetical protein LOD99_10612 [Oopsacas minuta]